MTPSACDECLRRTWLVGALAGHIANAAARRAPEARELLTLSDEDLLAGLAGRSRAPLEARHEAFDAGRARDACAAARVTPVCRHSHFYPSALADHDDRPAVLHISGELTRFTELLGAVAVAVVGARRASSYGLEVARSLGRGLSSAGVTVISGMALGVDSAAHDGAVEIGGPTLAVLAGGPDRPYPSSKRCLHAKLIQDHAVISELPPGFVAHKWCFPARNRIIAGLSKVTVVVEAAERSGSLITADLARQLGRDVGAVPGRVSSPLAAGTNQLIIDGAHPIRGAEDVLDLVFGAGGQSRLPVRAAGERLDPRLRSVLDAVACGRDSAAALATGNGEAGAALIALAELELLGLIRRVPGGRYVPVL